MEVIGYVIAEVLALINATELPNGELNSFLRRCGLEHGVVVVIGLPAGGNCNLKERLALMRERELFGERARGGESDHKGDYISSRFHSNVTYGQRTDRKIRGVRISPHR